MKMLKKRFYPAIIIFFVVVALIVTVGITTIWKYSASADSYYVNKIAFADRSIDIHGGTTDVSKKFTGFYSNGVIGDCLYIKPFFTASTDPESSHDFKIGVTTEKNAVNRIILLGNKSSDAKLVWQRGSIDGNPEEPPELRVTVNSFEIMDVMGKNTWNNAKYDREDMFKVFASGNEELLYVPLGERIVMEFPGRTPDAVKLEDYVLDKDGNITYTDGKINVVDIQMLGNKVEFDLIKNNAVYLSSISSDYEAGESIRGFRLTCSWGKDECEYAFMLRTDAS